MKLLKKEKSLIGRSKLLFALAVVFPFSLSAGEIGGDIISSLSESNREANEYYNNKMSSYRCLLTGNDNTFDCQDQGIDIYNMYEASRFDVVLNKKNSLEKIVFMEISGVNNNKFSEYEEKTLKRCVKNIRCESMNVNDGSTTEKRFDIMFVLHGGTEVINNTILIGYSEPKQQE